MPTSLCLQRRLTDESDAATSSSEMNDIAAELGRWQDRFTENIVDLGGTLVTRMLVTTDDDKEDVVSEVNDEIGGCMILSTETLDESLNAARACPGPVRSGSGVEVIEIRTP